MQGDIIKGGLNMSNLVTALLPVGKAVTTVFETGAGGPMGMGCAKLMHSFLGVSLAGFSLMQGLGVQSNEIKELAGKNITATAAGPKGVVDNTEGVGARIIARAKGMMEHDFSDSLAAGAAAVGSFAIIVIADTWLGGTYIPAEVISSFGYAEASGSSLMYIPATLISTVSDSVMDMSIVKFIETSANLALATMSALQSKGIESNEIKEEIKKEERVSSELSARAWRAIMQDGPDLLKSGVAFGIGYGGLFVGSMMGGVSMQVRALRMARGFFGNKDKVKEN